MAKHSQELFNFDANEHYKDSLSESLSGIALEGTQVKVYVTRAGFKVPRLLFMLIAGFVGAVLTITMVPGGAIAADDPSGSSSDPAPADKADSDGDGDADRPDAVSAAVTARLLKKPVEDLSKRTETTRTMANPDGTLSDEDYGTAVRVKGENGSWDDVDYDLEEQADGSYAPKVAAEDVTVGNGQTKEAARIAFDDGTSLAVSWPEALPEPTIKGGVATYKLSDATDLLVVVTGNGVATRIRLNQQPAADDPAFTLGLRADDLDVKETSAGGLKVTDEDGKQVGTTSTMTAWDAQLDESGDPVNVVPVDSVLSEGSSTGDVTKHELELTAPQDFLADPETQYPVIIDPDINAVSHIRDTWVRSGTTSVQGSSYRLLLGRIGGDSNTNPAIAYEQWSNSQLSGKKILKATMGLYQYDAGSCSSRSVSVHPLTSGFTEASTVYTNRPSWSTSTGDSVSFTTNRARTGCTVGNGYVEANITNMVDAWAKGTYTNYGLQMNVPPASVTDATYERRWCSSLPDTSATATPCTTSTRVPYLKVTYNGPPRVPVVPTTTGSRTWNGALYVGSATPSWSTSATDGEASQVKYTTEVRPSTTSSTVSATCATALVASGTAASCASTTTLTNGTSYVARSKATDSYGLVGGWSAWQAFTVDTTNPPLPGMSCTDFADGQWYENPSTASTTCTITAAAGDDIDWKVNTTAKTALTLSGGSATTPSITVPASGYTHIEARTRTRAGTVSAWKSYAFGTGAAVLTEPIKDDRSTSTFPVNAAASPGADSAKLQWRFAPDTEGDTTTGWADATQVKKASDVTTTWDGGVTGTDMSNTPRLIWDPQQETGIGTQGLVEVRVVFSYPGSVTKASPLQRVQVIPHAFGGSFPTEEFGPGQAALFTGEFQLSETDVEVPGYGESLTLGRSHLTLAGEPAGPTGVFGPGWVADLNGPEAGAAGYTVVDRTAVDGTFQLVAPEGDSYVYLHSTKTKGAQQAGTYQGVGETALEEDSLKLAAVTGETGITHRLTLTEWDRTKTIFVRTSSGIWTTEQVVSPEANSTTTYAHNSDGTVSWIFAPAPAGAACDTSSQQPGCRALNLVYTGTGADKRLSEVKLRIWDPTPGADGKPGTGAAMTTVSVAKYTYNSSGQLDATWDPRVADDSAALKTQYDYTDTSARPKIAKVTEPGLKPWQFAYTEGGKIKTISRTQDAAVGSGDAAWTIKYDLALAGNGDGLPNLSADATATWGQAAADAPTGGTAVFGPDQVPDSTTTAAQYEYADLSYFTQSGRTTNTGSFGADAWQIDSTRYDVRGNTVWSLPSEGRRQALAEGNGNADVSAGAADKYATITVYNAAGTRVEETYDPMRSIVLDNGTTMTGRTITQTDYDDEADTALMPGRPTTDVPADGYGLAVEERASVTDRTSPGADGNLFDTKKTRYRYDPVSSGDGDGWALKTPTRVLTQDGSGFATTLTRFDAEGKTIETRTPQGTETTNGAGSDTRSTKTVYYTADGSASRAECRSKAVWAGEVCWTGPAGQPGSGQPIPETTITGYSINLAPTRTEEISGAVTRTNITEFDAAGRQKKSSVTTSGLSTADRAVAATTTTYSATTGLPTTVTNGTQTQTTGYDTWGRTVSQTDGTGNTAATSYDTAGRVATANDGKGTYTYAYNGTDSRGKKERRGLVTSLDVGLASGADVFTGAYDAAGDLIEQTYPGGIKATWDRDITGNDTALTYEQNGQPLLGYSTTVDADGRARTGLNPGSEQTYTYDDRDRLTKVQDTVTGSCTTRSYGFSGDSDRTSLTTYGPDTNGACQTSTGGANVSSSFDAADRITTTGYAYDQLGRTKTIPAAHTSNATGGALSVGYHANDMVATLSQDVTENGATVTKAQDFTLDAADRLSVTKNLTAGVSLVESTNHYDSTDDSPSWTETKTRPDAATAWATAWNRNVAGLTGDMAVIAGSDGSAKLQLGNLHGDIAATVAVGGTGIDAYSEYTEYGLARDNANTPERYGWLGAKQRDTATVGGLTLMGARLYNPTTGRFLSMDPIAGGNDNTYTYPVDPINMFDLNGEWGWKKIKRWGRRAGRWAWKNKYQIGASLACGASVSCGMAVGAGFAARRYLSSKKKKSWRGFAWSVGRGAASGYGGKLRKVGTQRLWLRTRAWKRGGNTHVGRIRFTRPQRHYATHRGFRSRWKFWRY